MYWKYFLAGYPLPRQQLKRANLAGPEVHLDKEYQIYLGEVT